MCTRETIWDMNTKFFQLKINDEGKWSPVRPLGVSICPVRYLSWYTKAKSFNAKLPNSKKRRSWGASKGQYWSVKSLLRQIPDFTLRTTRSSFHIFIEISALIAEFSFDYNIWPRTCQTGLSALIIFVIQARSFRECFVLLTGFFRVCWTADPIKSL